VRLLDLVHDEHGGGLMVITGLLLATGLMEQISKWFITVTGFQGF
jgi:hypothetical protein